jgi:hypothetical protein
MGDRDIRRPALGRAPGARGRHGRSRQEHHPGPLGLGSKGRPGGPKSRAGRRTVPIAPALRLHLVEQQLARGRRGGLFFGRRGGNPFSTQAVSQRAERTWRAAGLEPIGLHDCLHTFASLMIAAGVKREGPVGLHGACVDHDDPRPGACICPRALRMRRRVCSTPTSTTRRRASEPWVCCRGAAKCCTNMAPSGSGRGRPESTAGVTFDPRNTCKSPTSYALKRRGRDSNPRWTVRPTTVFEAAPERPPSRW